MKKIDRSWWKDSSASVDTEILVENTIRDSMRRQREIIQDEKKRRSKVTKVSSVKEQHYSTNEWAKRLGYTAHSIRQWVKAGLIEAIFIRGQYRISESAIMTFVEGENRKRA